MVLVLAGQQRITTHIFQKENQCQSWIFLWKRNANILLHYLLMLHGFE